jgi:ergothioneine biosynthesis protein EgtB
VDVSVASVNREAAIEWYRRNRMRSEAIFDLIDPAAYYTRPIALRNPIVFYEGHLPAFSVIAFLRRGLQRPAVDRRLEDLFARGIDPETTAGAVPRSGVGTIWPRRDEVRAFGRACDEAVLDALETAEMLPVEGLFTALEHEAMHQETLLYMWHRLAYEQKRKPSIPNAQFPTPKTQIPGSLGVGSWKSGVVPTPVRATTSIPAGEATLGARRGEVIFGWDNEFDAHDIAVRAFDIDVLPVTNAQFLEFVRDAGYTRRDLWSDEAWEWLQTEQVRYPAFWLPAYPGLDPRSSDLGQWHWRGMFQPLPLPPDWPVYVSHAEASAYARWKRRRLMTEAEFHRAAEGATAGHADFAGFDPVPVGAHPGTASAHGVLDLIGNGWEWTSTVFAPFPGFSAMTSYPEYSADFFDGRHFVLKGASPATAAELVRPSFRNWFRGNYPYVYAKFRTVTADNWRLKIED